MKKTVKKMAMGGPVGGMPTQAAAGLARRPSFAGNAGGAVRGQARAAMVGGKPAGATPGARPAAAGYAKGGMIKEYGGKEKYASKSAMARHEAKESKATEKAEKAKGMKGGGMVKGKKC